MNKSFMHIIFAGMLAGGLLVARPLAAQQVTTPAADKKSELELEKKASDWTVVLKLNDAGKAEKIKTAILTHLTAVRDWHNSHPFTLTPAGINPATGNKLSDMDRQIIVCSTKPGSIHDDLMMALKTQLDTAQVAMVLDKYTIGKLAFTLKGYQAIVPDLTAKEEAEILRNLQQAREQAIDYKGIKEVSAIFEIYKTKCEQYLNNNGRNWRQLFKTYVDKIKAEKQAEKNKHQNL
ncbi:MAG: DUF3826 domain-containing protein [Chitinophagaceae bacterium]